MHGPEGGGRNIGEACHVYDLFDSLVGGAEVEAVTAQAIRPDGTRLAANDNFVATIRYADGSVCTLTYTALGNRDHPKERMEVFADDAVLTLDDYKSLVGHRRRPRLAQRDAAEGPSAGARGAGGRDPRRRPVADLAGGAAARDADRLRGRGTDPMPA